MSLHSFLYGYDDTRVTEINVLSIEDRGSNVFVNFSATYEDGESKLVRIEARELQSRYDAADVVNASCVARRRIM